MTASDATSRTSPTVRWPEDIRVGMRWTFPREKYPWLWEILESGSPTLLLVLDAEARSKFTAEQVIASEVDDGTIVREARRVRQIGQLNDLAVTFYAQVQLAQSD